ncbi:hypothetical protein EH228_14230 [Erwinia endophytica]|uniref:hypothetical protein n=1 Tax=Erwinia endophytica TaxID=1563158 RepID=UPI001265EDF1|nr:hypothetical protein [Erwinia endophytica]KAB8308017.1 hypothetical protein EH228_14230 [Erwinia endophytica]
MLQTVYHSLENEADWLKTHPDDAAKILSPLWGNLDPAIVKQANSHRSYQVRPVTKNDLGEQQQIADVFFQAKLLPRAVDARDVSLWQPAP